MATGSAENGNPLKVAVVVPTYNEAETLPALIAKVIEQNIFGLGFVIVDD